MAETKWLVGILFATLSAWGMLYGFGLLPSTMGRAQAHEDRLDRIEFNRTCDQCVAFCMYKGGDEEVCYDECVRRGEC